MNDTKPGTSDERPVPLSVGDPRSAQATIKKVTDGYEVTISLIEAGRTRAAAESIVDTYTEAETVGGKRSRHQQDFPWYKVALVSKSSHTSLNDSPKSPKGGHGEARRRDNRDRSQGPLQQPPSAGVQPGSPGTRHHAPSVGVLKLILWDLRCTQRDWVLDVALSCAEGRGHPGCLPAAYLCRESGFDLVPTGANTPREVDVPLPPTATPRHPPIEAPVAKFYDEPLPDLDREAA